MRIFEFYEENGSKKGRLLLGMGIKNNTIRRLWVLITIPPMFLFNILQVLIFASPYFIFWLLRHMALNNAGLWDMSIKRWNEPRKKDE